MGRWLNILANKNKTDQARAKIFTKMGREMIVAIKMGGSADPNANSKLRDAIAKAKANNVPNDNIARILKKAMEDNSSSYEDIVYEGYGPCGVAIMVETSTNNKNRTAADVRHAFDKFGGNLGNQGSVSYMFERMGIIDVEVNDKFDEDEFTMFALETGAEDVEVGEEMARVLTKLENFKAASDAFASSQYKQLSADLQYVPQTESQIASEEDRAKYDKLISSLEENDDVMNVYSNLSE